MNINIIILIVLYILGCIYITLTLLLGKEPFFKNLSNTMAFIVISLLIFHFFLCSYIYISLTNAHGSHGPPGIEGKRGNDGKSGKCTSECGQQNCYTIITNNISTFLKNENRGTFENTFLKNKINKICFSDNYQGFLTSKLKKKPTEKDLIDYLNNTVLKWIKIILSNKQKNGTRFLNNSDYDETYYDPNITPFNEIKKYEIWDWGEPYKIKPIIRRQCTDKKQLPKSDISDLDIIYTNDYEEPIFTTQTRKNTYGPKNCPYNQLGSDFSNPRDITKCFYYNEKNEVIKREDVWLNEEFIGFKRDISFYNISKRTINGKTYYPVGTVWRGNKNPFRSETTQLFYGPSKKTILVSGDIKHPKDFKKIWSSEDCKNCIPDTYSITIWRPEPPKGYVCLGDYVSQGTEKPKLDSIACIRNTCVTKLPTKKDTDVWNTDGFVKRVKKEEKSKAIKLDYSGTSRVSIWPLGITEKQEDILNLSYKKIDPIRIGGYNLFRANNSFLQPKETGWELKSECYTIMPTQDPDIPNNDMGVGWLGGRQRDNDFSVFPFLGYTINGIVDNYPVKSDQSFYIEHVEGNDYSIKTANKDTGKFDTYLRENHETINSVPEKSFDKNVSQLLWTLDIKETIKDKGNKYPILKLKSKSNNKCILQKIDTLGNINLSLVDCNKDGSLWKFTPSTGF